MTHRLDPGHEGTRAALRVIGPAVAVVGLILTLVGMGNFFAAFGGMQPPRYFWCAFVGLPLMGVGLAISKFAFLGAISRYMAGEVAPVGKDFVNYMASGSRDAIRDVAAAVGEGIAAGSAGPAGATRCPHCGGENDLDASYCSQCGTTLTRDRRCGACGEPCGADARYCDHCGQKIEP